MLRAGQSVRLPGIAEPCAVAWYDGRRAGIKVPWQDAPLVISIVYLQDYHDHDVPDDDQQPAKDGT